MPVIITVDVESPRGRPSWTVGPFASHEIAEKKLRSRRGWRYIKDDGDLEDTFVKETKGMTYLAQIEKTTTPAFKKVLGKLP